MKRGTIQHPKTKALAEALGVPLAQAVGHLHALWEFTAEYAPTGDLSHWPESVIEEMSLWKSEWKSGQNPPPHENNGFIAVLVETHWLDRIGGAKIVVHDWPEHCEDWVHHRLYRRKLKFWNGNKPFHRNEVGRSKWVRS